MGTTHWALSALIASTLAIGCSGSEDPQAAADGSPQHCFVLIDKLQPGETTSNVVEQGCSADEAEANTFAAADDRTLIMTWYSDANYEGDSTKVYGKAGECDDAGYGIPNVGVWDDLEWPFGGWNDRISSFKTWNYCNHAAAYQHENYGGRCDDWYDPGVAGLGIDYVGDNMNDMITSFFVKRGEDKEMCR